MTKSELEHICRVAAGILGLPETDDFVNSGMINIDNVDVFLQFDPEVDEDRLHVVLNIGQIGENYWDAATRELLVLNSLVEMRTSGVYATDPGTKTAIFVVALSDLAGLTGEGLVDALCRFAAQARFARETIAGFSDGNPTPAFELNSLLV
jgi:hypothetical protein